MRIPLARVMVISLGCFVVLGCSYHEGGSSTPSANKVALTTASSRKPPIRDAESARVAQVFAEELPRYVAEIESSENLMEDFLYWNCPSGLKSDDVSRIIDHGQRIRILDFSNFPSHDPSHDTSSPLTDAALLQLKSLPRLSVLILGDHHHVTAAGLAEFRRQCPECVVRIFSRNCIYIPQSKFLASLGVSEDRHVQIEIDPPSLGASPFSDEDIRSLEGFHEIESIRVAPYISYDSKLRDCTLTNDSMRILSGLPRLVYLEIGFSPGITNEGLKMFLGHPTLKHISLAGTSVTLEEFEEFLKAMPQMESWAYSETFHYCNE